MPHERSEAAMRKGKISESVLKRSVLKYINSRRDEVVKGAGIGTDCAFLKWNGAETKESFAQWPALSAQTVTLPVKEAGKLAVYAAVNNLAAAGAKPVAVTASVTLPFEAEEALLKDIMKQIGRSADELKLQIAGGHTEVTDSVKAPIITITALGKYSSELWEKAEAEKRMQDKTKLDIVMTKWIGMEGTVILAKEKEEELLTRYPISLIRSAQGFEKYLPIIPEAATALKSGVYAMHDMRNGGVFGALFELARSMGVGLSVDLKQIPVKQETIEICEFYDLNPYELLSGGSLLILTEDGKLLVKELREKEIFSAVIGKTTAGNDKIVLNDEEIRFLEPAKTDEIFKINF